MPDPTKARPAPPMVLVRWEDASNVATWEDYDDAVRFEMNQAIDYRCTSVGYLIRDDEECVIVAGRSSGDFSQVGLFERIPRGMVLSVTRLQEAPDG